MKLKDIFVFDENRKEFGKKTVHRILNMALVESRTDPDVNLRRIPYVSVGVVMKVILQGVLLTVCDEIGYVSDNANYLLSLSTHPSNLDPLLPGPPNLL